jgi:hypothetical protein
LRRFPSRGLAFTTPLANNRTARAPFHKETGMGLEEDIIKLLKHEGFKINEAIKDALDEFVDIVDEENEDMEENLDDDEDKGDEEE